MTIALFISLLLLGTPVQSAQDSVSAQRVEKLESRITELEKQVLEYRAREDYFRSILASQRWTFGTVVGLFAALLGLVGFGAFKHYVGRVEETQEEMEERVDDLTTELKSELSGLSEQQDLILDRIRVLERSQEMGEVEERFTSVNLATYPSTFLEKARDVRNQIPTSQQEIVIDVKPSLSIMKLGLKEINRKHNNMPLELKNEGLAILKEINERLEGWDEAKNVVNDMIQTIEEG